MGDRSKQYEMNHLAHSVSVNPSIDTSASRQIVCRYQAAPPRDLINASRELMMVLLGSNMRLCTAERAQGVTQFRQSRSIARGHVVPQSRSQTLTVTLQLSLSPFVRSRIVTRMTDR